MKDNLAALGQLFWQFEIAGVPLPHLTVQGKVGKIEGQWWLKVWGERLLFCAADAPGRVFAVVTPCHKNTDLIEFWLAAIQGGDYGELFFHLQNLTRVNDGGFLTIFADDGIAWTREWCGGKWMPRSDIEVGAVRQWKRHSLATYGSLNLHHSPFRLDAKSYHQARDRYFPERERQNFKPLWLRGSRAEWKSALQACVTLFGSDKELPRGFRKRTFIGFAHAPFFKGWFYGVDESGFWGLPTAWRLIFKRNFVYVGWRWVRSEKYDVNKLAGWEITSFITAANIQFTRQPSQHQQLEARLYLRDWLRGKVPDAQIAKLLE